MFFSDNPRTQLLQAETGVKIAVENLGDYARGCLLHSLLSEDMAQEIIGVSNTCCTQGLKGEKPDLGGLLRSDTWELLLRAAGLRLGYEM